MVSSPSSASPPNEINRTYRQIAAHFCRYTIGAGVIGTLIGMIQFFHGMSDPSSIGAGMAVLLVTMLYAVVASEVYSAFLYHAYAEKAEDAKPLPSRGVALAAGVVALCLVLWFALLMVFTNY